MNIPLAAGVLGLVLRATRKRLPPPRGALWSASRLHHQVADGHPSFFCSPPRSLSAQRFRESASASPRSTLCRKPRRDAERPGDGPALLPFELGHARSGRGLGYAIVWADFGKSFARKALWSVAASFLPVMVLGALGLPNRIDLQALYLRPIHPRSLAYEGFQSIFWNPNWFAFYFVIAFGLVAGLLWTEALRRRGRKTSRSASASGSSIPFA